MGRPVEEGVLGVFDDARAFIAFLRRAKEAGVAIRDIYSPVHLHEVEEILTPGRSPVGFLTFIGAALGLLGGLALALWTSGIWEMVVGGKPVYSLVPFIVVGFEFTILLGAIATLVGLLILARLPFRRFPSRAYRPDFSKDRFGVLLSPPSERVGEARKLLEEAGAVEVEDLGGTS